MSACMITATLVVPAGTADAMDFDAARRALDAVKDPTQFNFEDAEVDIDVLLPDLGPEINVVDDDRRLLLGPARQAGHKIIDNLAKALNDDSETDLLRIAGYEIFISGGPSWGDPPTDAAEAIWDAYKLPVTVLEAMKVVLDARQITTPKEGTDDE